MTVPFAAAGTRLDEHRSQAVFRVLLDTLARPGSIGSLLKTPPGAHADAPPVPPVLLPALALADVEVPFAIDGATDADRWLDVIRLVTGAVPAPWDDAALAVCLDPPAPGLILRLRRGNASEPELGARLCLACSSLHAGTPPNADAGPVSVLTLRGPGIAGQTELRVVGLHPAVFREVAHANSAFPAGIDIHLVADDGAVASIPRSTTITVRAEGGE